MRILKNIGWIAAVFIFMFSCSMGNSKKVDGVAKDSTSVTENKKIIPVRIQRIEKEEIDRTVNRSVNLIAYKEINYAPASPGRINKIYVEIGSRVQKGQVLVEMDRTQFNQAATQYENAKINYQRIDTLHQLGSISEQTYDQTKTQYEVAKSSYEYLSKNTVLHSPINGIVTGKYYENGELYSGAPNTTAGKAAIITLMQINPLKALVSISQSYFPDIKEGMKATIATDLFPGTVFQGKVLKVYPTIDPATRTFKTEIVITNNAEKLRPGMFANIEIKLEKVKALVVPSSAVLKQEGTNTRYLFINDNNKAKKVKVKMGKQFDDKVEIISNEIKEGEEFVIEGQAKLLDGSEIKIVD